MKKKVNMDIELIFIVLSVIVTGGLAINAHISSNKKDDFLNKKTEKIVVLQNKLNDQSEKLIEVQNELLKYTTGGDSFGEVQILKFSDGEDDFYYIFYFLNRGKYPLYDVNITTLDRSSFNKEEVNRKGGVATGDDLMKYLTYKVGDVGANSGKTFYSIFRMKKNVMQNFLFSIDSREKKFYQQLKFIEKDSQLLIATELKSYDRSGNGKTEVLLNRVDENFPGVKEGTITWE